MTQIIRAIMLTFVLVAPSMAAAQVVVGQPAPDFHATTFDGRKISLADYRGHVLVINFWATWCGPCRRELPLLDAYYKAQRPVGLEVIAVATENSVPAAKLKPLAEQAAIPFIKALHGPYKVIDNGVPTNIVIDRNGIVRYAKAGGFTLDGLNEILVPLLQEPADPIVSPSVTPTS